MNESLVPLILQLSQAAPELLKKLLKCHVKLSATLRGTSRELRGAVNKTVRTIKLSVLETYDAKHDAIDITSELAATFTNAHRLILDFSGATTTAEVTLLLKRLQARTPELLGNLQTLTVTINLDQANALGSSSLLEFLHRCTKLSAVQFALRRKGGGFTLSFSGQGTNPAEHLDSMQAQIDSFAATPCFLLAPSWPAHPCLTSIVIDHMNALFPQPSLDLLTHLTSAVSLQSLTLATVPGPVSSELQAGISALTNLTHLSAPTHDSAATALDTFWVSAGLLPSLQQLTVTPSSPAAMPFSIPRAWEYLTALTHLALGTPASAPLHLASPDALRWVPTLRSVALAIEHTSLQALSSLRQLTALRLHTAGDVPGGGMACGLASWRSSLKQLAWGRCVEEAAPCIGHWTALTSLSLKMAQPGLPECMLPAVAGLQALRELRLVRAEVSAELCGALGDLQQLSSLTLLAPHSVKPALPTNQVLLPRLPALRTLTITGPDGATTSGPCLDLLMRWLHVSPHLKIDTGDGCRGSTDTHVSVPQAESLGGGWLEAIIANQIHASFLLATPEGTRALAARLPNYERPLEVVVWYAMTPQEMAQLASMTRSKSVSIRQLARRKSAMVPGPPGGARLVTITDEHLLALLGAVRGRGLEKLELGGCRALTDDGLLEFVKAGGAALKKVALSDASVLTDVAMFALHRYCPELHQLTLQGAPLVTEMGVVPVVGSAPAPLRMFEFVGTNVGFDALAGMVEKLGSLDIQQANDVDHIVVIDKDYGVPLDYEEMVEG